MKHFGDITKINGHAVPIVDIITGGSPCQDLSVAGKREGLKKKCHNYITCGFEIDAKSELDRCPWCGSYLDFTRSGLFMEQIRIIKEMHDACRRTNVDIRPRYMVWENVPGAFSSNGGADFHAVLEETAKVAERDASIPRLEKWPQSGAIMGDGWSIAWRVHNAQFWGVPQRRKRIALVADFRGGGAPEILFERKGLSGDLEPSGAEREEVAGIVEGGAGSTGVYCLQGNGIDRADTAGCNGKGWRENQSYTLNTIDRPAVYDARGNGDGETVPTITGDHENRITDYTAIMTMQAFGSYKECGVASGLKSRDYKDATDLVFAAVDCRNGSENQDINGTLQAKETGQNLNGNNVLRVGSHVRRLTPLECERLQGYPDHWTDIGEWTDSKGKKHKDADSPRYKALGNSIALPFWEWMAKRMVEVLKADGVERPTMASLFDGIGGFPLAYSRAGCDPVWASEIEEFPIAVTKIRFPEEGKHEQKDRRPAPGANVDI